MSKYKAPPPGLSDTVAFLSDDLGGSLYVALCVYPLPDPHRAMATVEVRYTHNDGTHSVVKREGETIATRSQDQLSGAWFRAALRLHLTLEGKDADEVLREHLWRTGLRR